MFQTEGIVLGEKTISAGCLRQTHPQWVLEVSGCSSWDIDVGSPCAAPVGVSRTRTSSWDSMCLLRDVCAPAQLLS